MFLVTVKTLINTVLTFKVLEYIIEDGFVCFFDKNNLKKKFPIERCQIEEQKVIQ
jgi:hypothetical protein